MLKTACKLLLVVAALIPAAVSAQDYPSKAIKLK
jgi:hypothetical protein